MAINELEYQGLLANVKRNQKAQTSQSMAPFPKIPAPKQNKTELYYESRYLAPQKHTGKILAYRFEPFKLLLVHGIPGGVNEMSYTPDFLVVTPEKFRVIEVKANRQAIKEDAWVKLKTAVELFPWFEFVLAFVNPKAGTIQEEILN